MEEFTTKASSDQQLTIGPKKIVEIQQSKHKYLQQLFH